MIGDAPTRSLVQELGIPNGDRVIIISKHGEDELFIDPAFMEMNRTANVMIIRVMVGAHRPLTKKLALMAAMTRLLEEHVDISPDDVFISLVPSQREFFI